MRITIIGAGSQSFGRGQIADLLQSQELMGRGVELVLVDENERALDTMFNLARRMKEQTGSDMQISCTRDRESALVGASYVIMAVARRRYELWEQDFRVPIAHGVKHVLGENGGPGALFHTLRSLEIVIPICRDIERICPDALLLNFTNPEARVLHAILHLTKVRAAGICHGVFGAIDWCARALDVSNERLEVTSAGMNHFYCLLKVVDRETGKDRLSEVLDLAKDGGPENSPPLFRKIAQVFDVVTFPSDDHTGEYLSFGSEYHGTKWAYGQESRRVERESAPSVSQLEECSEGRAPVSDSILSPSGEITVPIICDMELDRGARRDAVNVLNTGGHIANVPTGAAVEIPAMVDASGIHPINVGPLPEAFAAFMRPQFTIHELITEAYRTSSRKLLMQALLLDPCTNSIEASQKMLDEMLKLQKDFLPVFT